jgi:hypothetical protein
VGTGRSSGRDAQHPQQHCSDGLCPALRRSPGRAPRGGGVRRRFSAGRAGRGRIGGPRLRRGKCAARAEAAASLHHRPPPFARYLYPHPPAALGSLASSPAPLLRLLPGTLGSFRPAVRRRAHGNSASFAQPARSSASHAAPGRFPDARARPPRERAGPPIKEAGRARLRHYPLRSERCGAEAAAAHRSLRTSQPGAPTPLTPRSR